MIHQTSLEVLERVGVKVLGTNGLQVLSESGASVDLSKKTAKIPQHLVDEALKKAPRSFTLHGRNPRYQLRFGDKRNQPYFSMEGSPARLLDLETGARRLATLTDLERFYRLADALENVDHAGCAVWPTDVAQPVSHAYALFAGYANTIKTQDGYNEGEIASYDTIRMASVVAGNEEELKKKPNLLGFTQPVSPLQYSKENVEGLMVYAKYNQP